MDLRIVPLGGLGEIGMNALVVESAGRRLLIDCGLLFPRLERGLGFDAYVPDLRYLLERPNSLDALVLTHGHEDHLGAVPVLLRQLKVPVYGGRFALGLLGARLRELGIDADMRELRAGERFGVGPFEVEPVHVNHSIPDAVGLVLRGAFGRVVHTGDFKVDPTPADGRPTDLAAFRRAGDEGVTCLLSDSTNAERPGSTPSERVVAQTLLELIRKSTGRVVVTLFASHLIRLQQLVELAAQTNRKLVVFGRSMTDNLRLGSDMGHIRGASSVVVDADQLSQLRPEEVLLATTGAQGESRSALWKMAFDPQSSVKIRAGDRVIFCARAIPGNEVTINELVNRLWELGASVIQGDSEEGGGPVHVSGHASQAEQLQVLNAVRPATFVPIHGEARQLASHVRVASTLGGNAGEHSPQCVLARDGDILEFPELGSAHVVGQAPVGRVAVISRGGSVLPVDAIAQRAALAEGGLVVVTLLVERASGMLLRSPELSGVGMPQDPALLMRAREVVRDEISELSEYARHDPTQLRDAAIRGVYRSFRRDGERRPVVQPVVIEV